MNRRALGIGVLVASVALVVAAASVAPGARPEGPTGAWSQHQAVLQSQPQQDAPDAVTLGTSRLGQSSRVGGPGQVVEPYGGTTNAAVPAAQRDSACPNNEPCGP